MKLGFIVCLFLLFLTSCATLQETPSHSSRNGGTVLKEEGWDPSVKKKLEVLIAAEAGKNLPVVFDFDNTIVCRDIGEATFGVLIRDGVLSTHKLAPEISPNFLLREKGVSAKEDLANYYEQYLEATAHHAEDPAPYLNGYGWLVEAMAGLTPQQIIVATEKAYGYGIAEKDTAGEQTKITVRKGGVSYLVPYFYPQMIELVGAFLENGYDVWVISASNVWTVRWMVTKVLNQKLVERGIQKKISPNRIIGIATLLQDAKGRFYKDRFLVKEDPAYAALHPAAMEKYKLTSRIHYPMPAHMGKLANILLWIGKPPYFVAGDSPNDHPMLAAAQYRLWIARLEKPAYQKETLSLVKKEESSQWLLQPVLTKELPGFIASIEELKSRQPVAVVDQSVALLQGSGMLGDSRVPINAH